MKNKKAWIFIRKMNKWITFLPLVLWIRPYFGETTSFLGFISFIIVISFLDFVYGLLIVKLNLIDIISLNYVNPDKYEKEFLKDS